MNRRGFFATIAALLFGTTTRPRGRYASASDAYVPRRARPGEPVITFSREPRQFPMRRYVKYRPVSRTTP